jgi:LuxR family maltose regulon positive regulatory protein
VLPRLGLARVHHVQGRRDAAHRCIAECRHLPDVRLDWHFHERIAEVEGHLRMREGEYHTAIAGLPALRSARLRLVEVRALAALGEHEQALNLLNKVRPPGARRGIQIALVLARCLPQPDDRREALEEAVHLAEQGGYLRILLDEQQWLVDRLIELVPTWPSDYVRQVLDLAAAESSTVVVAGTPVVMFSALSTRELEVWRYLATPLSLTEIARRLFISRNTMKTHVRNIYRKLGVTTREQAVGVQLTEHGVHDALGGPLPPGR